MQGPQQLRHHGGASTWRSRAGHICSYNPLVSPFSGVGQVFFVKLSPGALDLPVDRMLIYQGLVSAPIHGRCVCHVVDCSTFRCALVSREGGCTGNRSKSLGRAGPKACLKRRQDSRAMVKMDVGFCIDHVRAPVKSGIIAYTWTWKISTERVKTKPQNKAQ